MPNPTHTDAQGYESTVITIVKPGGEQQGQGEEGKGGNKSSAVVVEDQVTIEVCDLIIPYPMHP